MKNSKTLLFPYRMKTLGYVLVVLSLVLLILCYSIDGFGEDIKFPVIYDDMVDFLNNVATHRHWFTIGNTSLFTTFIPVLFWLGALFVCFSQEKIEDEMIIKIREQSLVWAIEVGFFLLIFCCLFVNGITYLFVKRFVVDVLLILFFIKFRWEIHRMNKSIKAEDKKECNK